MTDKCRPLLRGEYRLELRKPDTPEQHKKKSRQPARGLATDDEALFEALRTLRRALAKDQDVPPYIIFHDTTLQEMARTRPADLEQLRRIPGVGAQKLKRYGARFLDELAQYARGRPPGDDPGDPIDAG